jgi:CheY-like chemotaxis protein
MSPDVCARIFEPFYTTKEVGKGTGLGLSTVHGIVKQSGGHIEVSSELGQGTTFTVYLPRVEESADSGPEARRPTERYEGTETILLVDDEESIRRVVLHSLESRGYTVIEAVDCREAITLAERSESRIDLLVTDVVMPRMNGPELAERVASIRPGIRTLFMSGCSDPELIQGKLQSEGSAFLQKPFTPDVLAQKVREVLDQPRQAAA